MLSTREGTVSQHTEVHLEPILTGTRARSHQALRRLAADRLIGPLTRFRSSTENRTVPASTSSERQVPTVRKRGPKLDWDMKATLSQLTHRVEGDIHFQFQSL